jgi:6-phosphofructokinase 2
MEQNAMADFLTITMNPALDLSTIASHVEHTHKIRCEAPLVHPGGGGINVSRVIHRLGGDCLAWFPVGGRNGEALKEMLLAENVPYCCMAITGETRESFSVHDAVTGKDFRFVFPGACLTALESDACLSYLTTFEGNPRYWVASGSLPRGVPENFYALLAKAVKRKGSRLALDTSGPALRSALNEGVFMIKPSLRELQELTGGALTSNDLRLRAVRKIISQGQAQIVALSLGEEGALLVTAEIALLAKGLSVNVVSTVGAGDSFLGGFLWSLNRVDDLQLALRFGMAAGAAALLSQGTSLCQVRDVQRLHGDVVTTHL